MPFGIKVTGGERRKEFFVGVGDFSEASRGGAGLARCTVQMQSRAKPQSRREMQVRPKALNAKGVAHGQGARLRPNVK